MKDDCPVTKRACCLKTVLELGRNEIQKTFILVINEKYTDRINTGMSSLNGKGCTKLAQQDILKHSFSGYITANYIG